VYSEALFLIFSRTCRQTTARASKDVGRAVVLKGLDFSPAVKAIISMGFSP
jgi:hypothetical protein